jgi:NAD(P)-dependent dehydrogenase (short-subunit alcohol dehydrogenase family)
MDHLAGRVALITGAGRGIGRSIALRLAAEGIRTALTARSEAQLRDTAALIDRIGGTALVVPADIGRREDVDSLKQRIEREFGAPSILVNAAGVFGPIGLVWNTDPHAWINTLMVNTVSAYLTCRAFVAAMIAAGWGRIVNVTSAAALHEPGPVNSAYGTSKAALNQFTRHLAAEIAGTGVTANVIHPGDVKTGMWAAIRDDAEALGPEAARYQQWARWVDETGGDDPTKAADLVFDLLGDGSAAINGRFLWIRDGLQKPVPSWAERA